ncbi:hypothetical protein [Vampirovibrio sp.]|uniref:hypothetical protein n=1 Tax=Vampirovibrio sp. TaxID=2717857 RepID=UPI003593323C
MIDSTVSRTVPSTRFSRPAREPRFGGQPKPPQPSASEKLSGAFATSILNAGCDEFEKEASKLPAHKVFEYFIWTPIKEFFKNMFSKLKNLVKF